jgi:hypothetical protein
MIMTNFCTKYKKLYFGLNDIQLRHLGSIFTTFRPNKSGPERRGPELLGLNVRHPEHLSIVNRQNNSINKVTFLKNPNNTSI